MVQKEKPHLQTIVSRKTINRERNTFVQLYHTNWDSHGGPGETLDKDFEKVCKDVDQASAGLIIDLKQRELLEDNLVIWRRIWRTPMGETRKTTGRDHHIDAFTMDGRSRLKRLHPQARPMN